MGLVWRARDELLGRDVAVKEMAWPPQMDAAEWDIARRRAVREAQMAARLSHPNVVAVYDIIEEDSRPWLVMELVPHRSLRDAIMADGPLSPGQAARVGLGILAALRAAHDAGVVHRDVKPANVLLAPEGRVVLTDFGIARATDSPALTGTSVLVGSPSYISPERARGEVTVAAVLALGGTPTIRRRLRALRPPARDRRRPPRDPPRRPRHHRPRPSASASASGGASALPAGYYRFTNSTGFSIGVPAGWQISHAGHYVYIRDPANSGIFLLIDQSDQPQPNALADWQQQAAARQSSYPDYHLIRLQAVSYPQAEQAADWEFTYDRNGIIVHILNRNVLANARHAYALYWSTPESDWNADYHYFTAFAATFRPAGVNQG
jgi:serine/threonine protein kinase